MVRCAHCSVNLPRSEAILSKGRFFAAKSTGDWAADRPFSPYRPACRLLAVLYHLNLFRFTRRSPHWRTPWRICLACA
jgi:hypothetical protein